MLQSSVCEKILTMDFIITTSKVAGLLLLFLLLLDCRAVSACGGNFIGRYGVITSPDYSSNGSTEYPANSNCSWTITTPVNTTVILTAVDFKLSCPYDYITVTDLYNKQVLVDQLCNAEQLSKAVFSYGNCINVYFHSDEFDNGEERGFKLVWKVKNILRYTTDFATWSDAQKICNEDGGTLTSDVTVYQDEIQAQMQMHYITQIWHGQFITPWVWLKGCIHSGNQTDIESFVVLKSNQMKECVKHCNEWNYFGLQGKKCYCFDTYVGESVVTETDCSTPCPGNDDERCGGNNFMTIYMNGGVCYNTSARTWRGTVSRTRHGNTCMQWKDIRAVNNDSSLQFPDGSAEEASNYCRSPNSSDTLWCYISQNQTEACDVPPCIVDKTDKNDMCMQVSAGDDFTFNSMSCKELRYSLCLGKDTPYKFLSTPKTWEQQRADARGVANSCKNMIGPNLFFIGTGIRGLTYWIGYVRANASARSAEVTGRLDKCYVSSLNNGELNTGGTTVDCDEKRHFICENVPVTCGEKFDNYTNGNFTTPDYPSNYDALMHCIWYVAVPDDHYTILTVHTTIEDSPTCQYDYVKVYEGNSIKGNNLGKLCGNRSQTFYNITSNITVEFLSDESEQSFGIFVDWTFVSFTLPTTTTSTDRFHDNDDVTEPNVNLSNGALAGIIIGLFVLVVLACIVGFLFGRRRNPAKDNSTKETPDREPNDNSRSSATILAKMNNEDLNLAHTGFEEELQNGDRPTDVSSETRAGDVTTANMVKADDIYSKVNKSATSKNGVEKKLKETKLASADEEAAKKTNQDDFYNKLNEKPENIYINKTDNLYNHFNEMESTYDSPRSEKIPKQDTTAIDLYDHRR